MSNSCNHHEHNGDGKVSLKQSAHVTFHCLIGCSIGEFLGLFIGSVLALSVAKTIGLAVILAFFFGISLAILPLVMNHKMSFSQAIKAVWIGEVVSITVMEIAMNAADYWLGGIGASVGSHIFWTGFIVALIAGFLAAWPVNHFLVKKSLASCH